MRDTDRAERTSAEHRAIAEAIGAQNSARALSALRSHLDGALAVMRRTHV
jgi:DNA-binding FadR family transcriptional regulator